MSHPSLPLQKAVKAALSGVAGGRIYDRIPPTPVWPFVRIGEDTITADFSAGDFFVCEVEVSAFSAAVGKPEVKALATAIYDALNTDLEIEGFETVEVREPMIMYSTAPDGKSEQAICRFEYLIQS